MEINSVLYNVFWTSFYITFTVIALLTLTFLFFRWKRTREEKKKQYNLTFMQIKLPSNNEIEIEAAEQMFAGFMGFKKSFLGALTTGQYRISFEIVSKKEGISFYAVVPDEIADFMEKQINAAYPSAEIDLIDPHEIWDRGAETVFMELKLAGPEYYPIKTFTDLKTDTLNVITSSISKLHENDVVAIQYILRPSGNAWRRAGLGFVHSVRNKNTSDKPTKVDENFLQGIEKKTAKPAFDVMIRVVSISDSHVGAQSNLRSVETAFEQFTNVAYNKFKSRKYSADKFVHEFIYRSVNFYSFYIPILEYKVFGNASVLNIEELATVFHFPNKNVTTPGIVWLGSRRAIAPSNVPEEGLFLGVSNFRGQTKDVFIREDDRRRHMYIIGQTGTGKSQFLEAMVLQDIYNGKGVAVIDPHGSDIDKILTKIPENRIEDVILFDVSDTERPLGLNLLEAHSEEQKNMVINAFIALLYKLYDPNHQGIMGPQLERAIRNCMLTAMADPESTMIDVMRMIIDNKYADKFLPLLKDPLVTRYWTDEMKKTTENRKGEMLGYIVSKFDRIVTEKFMRNIISQPKSSINFQDVMAEKKILLVDLSKGKIGEENSNFLGLLLVPRILMAALSRATLLGKEEFPDFYLYVDEFQNFATPDFATILSEARKYKLNLTVANQFIAQLSEEIKTAIFGNVGTMVSFRVGLDDSEYLANQFEPVFEKTDLINLPMGNAYMRLLVKGQPTAPFSMNIVWDFEKNDLSSRYADVTPSKEIAARIREFSRMKYGRPVHEVEEYINSRTAPDEPKPEENKFGLPDRKRLIPF
jgi:hypothetical protein